MQRAVLSLLLSGLGRDALKVVAGLVLAVVIALAFTIASLAALFGAAPGNAVAGARLGEIPLDQPAVGVPPSRVVDRARAPIGRPYVWGGASPAGGFDCSGLVHWAYRQVGLGLPRTARQQYDATVRITPAELRPGDLVFFARTYRSAELITHVGIYVGGARMINAPSEGNVIRDSPVFTGYWGAHYAGAGRVWR